MSAWIRDLRYAARGLWGTPGFTFVAIATLALGIGVNTAVFTVVRGVLMTPLPYSQPDQLVKVGGFIPGLGTGDLTASTAELEDYRRRNSAFVDVTAAWPLHTNLVGGDTPVRISTALVHPNFFDVLGVEPVLGRMFRDGEFHLGVGTSMVLSWDVWQRQFGGDESVVGQSINIDGDPVQVVGVMPRGFHHPGRPLGAEIEMWGALDMDPGGRWFSRNNRPLQLFARLRDGSTIENAQADLASIADELRQEFPQSYPDGSGWMTGVEPLRSEVVGGMERVLMIVFGAVGFVLLVACANVSALLLARGAARARQTAVRMALGSSRRDIARFNLAESLVLSLVGGFVATLFALGTTGVLRSFAARYMPRADLIAFDGSVLLFGLVVAAAAGLVFGMAPSIVAALTRPASLLTAGARGSTESHGRLRDGLVVAEVAVSVVLVVASGLLVRSFDALLSVDMGFDPENIHVVQTYLPVQIDPNEGAYRQFPNRVQFYSEVVRQLEEDPDVTAAAGISELPLRDTNGVPFVAEGQELLPEARPTAEYRVTTERYFEVMGIPLQEGRRFSTADNPAASPVVVVNEAWAERYAPDGDPVGMRIRLGNGNAGALREIVGVVGNVRQQSLDAVPRATIYAPYLQAAGHNMTFVFTSESEAGPLLERARQIVQRTDPDQPAFAMATMDEVVAASVAERRVLVWMVSLFGVLALALAGLGVFGVISFRVRQRMREIGIRMTLGAPPRSVAVRVLRDGVRLGVVGLAVGMVGALVSTRVLESMLYGIGRFDPLTVFVVVVTTLGVVAVGSLVPAYRAAGADPLQVIRSDG